MGNDERLRKELILKEERLLENSVRNDAGKLAELIDEHCIEFSVSGKQNEYRPGDLFEHVPGASYIDSASVRMIDLAEDCKLLSYVAVEVNKNDRRKSNHSSVWKRMDGKWKIVFHQGTNRAE